MMRWMHDVHAKPIPPCKVGPSAPVSREEVISRRRNGETSAKVAEDLGITTRRVQQIIAEENARLKRLRRKKKAGAPDISPGNAEHSVPQSHDTTPPIQRAA